jgi:hypothetical protein
MQMRIFIFTHIHTKSQKAAGTDIQEKIEQYNITYFLGANFLFVQKMHQMEKTHFYTHFFIHTRENRFHIVSQNALKMYIQK